MTAYFEVHGRDGPARLGELRLAEPVRTPALVDEFIEDAGSRWAGEPAAPSGGTDRLVVLPHRGFPAGTDERVEAAFADPPEPVEFPSLAVVSAGTAADHGADAYALSGAPGLVREARAFSEAVVRTRTAIPPDTALLASGVATPRNVAAMAWAGVDLFDRLRARIRGTQGRYLTLEGDYRLDDLDELPCPCPACRTPVEDFTREDCVAHNVAALEAAVATVRQRIRAGRLRDYLEGQARHEAWATAVLRELDDEWGYVEERTPLIRRAELTAATEDTLRRVEIRRFADRVVGRYRDRFDAPTVLLPCSSRKPYSESQSHRQFMDAIRWRGHVVSITSPIGVVPTELELTYPAQHYDAVVTGRWSAEEVDFVAGVLEGYLDRAEPGRVIAHVPPAGYRDVVERAAAAAGVDVEYTVEDHPTTEASLADLDAALADEPAYPKRDRERRTVRAIADYQLGDAAGDALFEAFEVSGPYPRFQVHDPDGEQLASLVPQYGLLAFTLEGARRWVDSGLEPLAVEIDAFVPHGSVLAPGVTDASGAIRVGDEVVVRGPEAFGVGRAAMSGPEMARSSRGIAVDVRHVEAR